MAEEKKKKKTTNYIADVADRSLSLVQPSAPDRASSPRLWPDGGDAVPLADVV
jgi:hypothetical protein